MIDLSQIPLQLTMQDTVEMQLRGWCAKLKGRVDPVRSIASRAGWNTRRRRAN